MVWAGHPPFPLDRESRACLNRGMAANTNPAPKTCECGCKAPVTRHFKPGHDAKLKSKLIFLVKHGVTTGRKEAAMRELLGRGWGYFLDAETLGMFVFQARDSKGRFAAQVHAAELAWTSFVDEAGVTHGVGGCADAHGATVEGVGSWVCTTCVRTSDVAELVWERRLTATQGEGEGFAF